MKSKFIIVGYGSSGLSLISSLLESNLSNIEIIVIERGNAINSNSNQSFWFTKAYNSYYSTTYSTTSQDNLGYRILKIPQSNGNEISGTNMINAMIFTGGYINIYDTYWPSYWSSKTMEKYILQAYQRINNSHMNYDQPFIDNTSYNFYYYKTFHKNQRLSIQQLYNKIHQNKNITIKSNCEVISLLHDKDTIIGVTILNKITNELENIYSKGLGEVILCCGVFESPKLLLTCPILQSNQYIGKNLQDHIIVPYLCLSNFYHLHQSHHDNSVHGWIYLDDQGKILSCNNDSISHPYLQLLIMDGIHIHEMIPDLLLPNFESKYYIYGFYIRPILHQLLTWICHLSISQYIFSYFMIILVCNIHPYSKGSIEFKTNNITNINPNYLSDKREIEVILKGISNISDVVLLLQQVYYCSTQYIIPLIPNVSWIHQCLIRYCSYSYYHPCGTCSMMKVVDEKCQVYGVKGLRVCDASIIPMIPSGPINAIGMALGEGLGDILIEKIKTNQ